MDNKEIGKKIKALRKQKNITITDLARIVDMSKSTVCSWENGQRRPEYEELQKLADLFGKSITYFFESDNQNNVILMSKEGVCKKYTLNDEQIKALESLAETMSKDINA